MSPLSLLFLLFFAQTEEGPVCAWVFDAKNIRGARVIDQAGGNDAEVHGPLNLTAEGLYLDGGFNRITISEGGVPEILPERDLAVEAWLAMDEIKEWGGIAGFIQDNGGFEKGWLLGSRGDRFTFALSTVNADDGDGLLTYLAAKRAMEPGRWHHVVGTYDGREQRIYVNGELENTSLVQSGKVLYPDRSFFDLAAYRDENEHYRWYGTLHEVRIYNRALGEEEVRERFEAKRDRFPEGLPAVDLSASPMEGDVPDLAGIDNPVPGEFKEAEWIVRQADADRGFCLVLGCEEGGLAFEIARLTRMRVIGVEPDAGKVESARRALDRVGAYGTRVTVHRGSFEDLPYPDYFANLVVLDHARVDEDEVFRLLRPYGGTAAFRKHGSEGGWTLKRRGPLEGAGEWTHMYADAGNTACSNDELVRGTLALQWFGRPGPRMMIDRHHRNVPPLCKAGRLFVPGDDRVIAVDAYNGTRLWEIAVPGSRRLGVFLDSSNMVVDDASLYLVHGTRCSTFDVASGRPGRSYHVPQVEERSCHWGYVAREGDLLLGAGRLPGASYTETSRAADSALWYDNMSIVTSRYLFALHAATGEVRWTYQSGLLINPTFTVGGGRIYFVESHSKSALENASGRMPGRVFLEGDANFLTALDLEDGRVIYRRKVDLTHCRLIVYLNYADEVLVLSGGEYVENKLWYFFHGLEAATGKPMWQQSHNSGFDPGGGHGEQNRHPTVVGGTVYTYPYAYDLETGERIEEYVFSRDGHGCGGVSASVHSLFWRGGNPTMRDVGKESRKINHVSRPGCWINIIPAGGLLLIPEASSGCTCAFPLQTSMAYRPDY